MNEKEQKKAAKSFAARWKGKGYEKGQSQQFWIDLLEHVYGVEDIAGFISFEDQVHLDHTSFIDGYIETTHVMIEQKSIGKDLRKGIRQSDGTLLNPFLRRILPFSFCFPIPRNHQKTPFFFRRLSCIWAPTSV